MIDDKMFAFAPLIKGTIVMPLNDFLSFLLISMLLSLYVYYHSIIFSFHLLSWYFSFKVNNGNIKKNVWNLFKVNSKEMYFYC